MINSRNMKTQGEHANGNLQKLKTNINTEKICCREVMIKNNSGR